MITANMSRTKRSAGHSAPHAARPRRNASRRRLQSHSRPADPRPRSDPGTAAAAAIAKMPFTPRAVPVEQLAARTPASLAKHAQRHRHRPNLHLHLARDAGTTPPLTGPTTRAAASLSLPTAPHAPPLGPLPPYMSSQPRCDKRVSFVARIRSHGTASPVPAMPGPCDTAPGQARHGLRVPTT
jgi:hypothetical protein